MSEYPDKDQIAKDFANSIQNQDELDIKPKDKPANVGSIPLDALQECAEAHDRTLLEGFVEWMNAGWDTEDVKTFLAQRGEE